MNTDQFDADLSEFEREILAHINEHGCHINFVFDDEEDEEDLASAPFAYSVGFTHTLDQGEVIVFGLPQELMHSMINNVMRQCRDDGLILWDGLRIAGLLEGFDVIARAIPSENITAEYFNSAMWHHTGRFGTDLTAAFQLVWPGAADGLFPWEDGCSPLVMAYQPPIFEKSWNS